jgi:ComF family protein
MLSSAGKQLLSGLAQIVYPNICWLCRELMPSDLRGFCSTCHQSVFTDPHLACPACAATVGPFGTTGSDCPTCRAERFAFQSAIRVGPYCGSLREVIVRLKHSQCEGLAEIVGSQWAAQAQVSLEREKIDCVVPVPLHWLRRWQRGYNQSAALAGGWAHALAIPLLPHGLRRVRDTKKQFDLPPAARRDNVRNVFRSGRRSRFQGRTVLLVDDVMTTGSTLHEASAALRRAGAARVVVAVLARA